MQDVTMEWWAFTLIIVVTIIVATLVGSEFAAMRVRNILAEHQSNTSAAISQAILDLGSPRQGGEAEMVTTLIRDVREMASAVNQAAPGAFDYEGVMARLALAEGSLHPQVMAGV